MAKWLVESKNLIDGWEYESKQQESTNKKHLSFYIPMPLYKMLKAHSVHQNKTMTKYLIVAIIEKLKREQ